MLAYRPDDPTSFALLLFNGEKSILYPLLHWLLTGFDAHKKRAYLAPYMTEVDVPQELFSDTMVMEIKQSCTQLKEEFVHSHKQLAMLQEATVDPQAKKDTIHSLDDERRQLRERVERLKKKLTGELENFDEVFAQCQRLRREQDDAKALRKRHREQTELVEQAKRALTQAEQRQESIKGGQAHLLQGDAVTMLEKLQAEVNTKGNKVRNTLPAELEERQQKLEDVKKILAAPSYSPDDVQQLQFQQQRLQQETQTLQVPPPPRSVYGSYNDIAVAAVVAPSSLRACLRFGAMQAEKDAPPPANDMLSMFRQQASMVARNKEKQEKSLKELQEQKVSQAHDIISSSMCFRKDCDCV